MSSQASHRSGGLRGSAARCAGLDGGPGCHRSGRTPGFEGDRDSADVELKALRDELTDFQERLWAEKGQALLIVLQAMDGGGKDGVIPKVFTAFNPQGTRVTGFGVPTDEELAHDFLWRVHPRERPGKGRIGIFNRSHYEDVLVVRGSTSWPRNRSGAGGTS